MKLIEFPFVGRQRFIIKEIKYILTGGDFGIDKEYIVLGLKDFQPPFNQIADRINSTQLNNPLQHLSNRVDFKAHLERLKQNNKR